MNFASLKGGVPEYAYLKLMSQNTHVLLYHDRNLAAINFEIIIKFNALLIFLLSMKN